MNKVTALPLLWIGSVSATCFAQAPLMPGFDVQNTSSVNVVRVFAKPEAAADWGSPLPASSVPAGRTVSVKVVSETNCAYDVRLVFADAHTEEHHKVDICKHERIQTGKTGGP